MHYCTMSSLALCHYYTDQTGCNIEENEPYVLVSNSRQLFHTSAETDTKDSLAGLYICVCKLCCV